MDFLLGLEGRARPEGTQQGREKSPKCASVLGFSRFPGLRAGAWNWRIQTRQATPHWNGGGLAGTCDSLTSTSSQISGGHLELEIEVQLQPALPLDSR